MGLVLKPTFCLTNSPCIALELARRCPRYHTHVPLVGARAAAATIYPHRLCCAMCKGIAAQIVEDGSGTACIRYLPMTKERVSLISLLCCEATGGYPPEIVVNGKFTFDNVQIEVDGKGEATGKFQKARQVGVTHPTCVWTKHLADYIHEFDGHGNDATGDDRDGELFLGNGLHTMHVQNGIQMARNDVSGALLEPALVEQGHEVEIT